MNAQMLFPVASGTTILLDSTAMNEEKLTDLERSWLWVNGPRK